MPGSTPSMATSAEARAKFERLAANDFEDLPVDTQWLVGMARVGEVAARLGDVERSRRLYDELAPFASEVVVVGRAASCNGPVTRYLGLFAATHGRTSDAIAHLEAALATTGRIGDRPWGGGCAGPPRRRAAGPQ